MVAFKYLRCFLLRLSIIAICFQTLSMNHQLDNFVIFQRGPFSLLIICKNFIVTRLVDNLNGGDNCNWFEHNLVPHELEELIKEELCKCYAIEDDAQESLSNIIYHVKNKLLLKSAVQGHKLLLQKLLNNGADCNAQTKNMVTPLMYASEKGYTDIVRVLLEHGADANMQDREGRTALMAALKELHADTVIELLVHGADTNIRSKNGFRVINYILWNSFEHSRFAKVAKYYDDECYRHAVFEEYMINYKQCIAAMVGNYNYVNLNQEKNEELILARSEALGYRETFALGSSLLSNVCSSCSTM